MLDSKFKIVNNQIYNESCYAMEILRDKVNENPILILKDNKKEVWIKTDRSYAIPKATYKILL